MRKFRTKKRKADRKGIIVVRNDAYVKVAAIPLFFIMSKGRDRLYHVAKVHVAERGTNGAGTLRVRQGEKREQRGDARETRGETSVRAVRDRGGEDA